ncbi:MAG: hypothetical protein DYH14_10795, partial [Betaproteobacteria bacterium PRO3]|nr:hypothetical protein [Betaproteobacteria bacterium PRO3]
MRGREHRHHSLPDPGVVPHRPGPRLSGVVAHDRARRGDQHRHRRRALDRRHAPVLASVRQRATAGLLDRLVRQRRAALGRRARLIVAVAVGSLIGIVLVILAKGYTWSYVTTKHGNFLFNFVVAFFNGVFFSLFFYVKLSAARAQATLARAEAERHLLSKQAVEAELKLMQAQVEPHFLFNTLASVQFL